MEDAISSSHLTDAQCEGLVEGPGVPNEFHQSRQTELLTGLHTPPSLAENRSKGIEYAGCGIAA